MIEEGGTIYGLSQSASPVFLFSILVLIIVAIALLSWLCRSKFAVVFCSLFAIAIFCAIVGISPSCGMKNTATSAIANWWKQTPIPPSQTIGPSPKSNSGRVWLNSHSYVAGGDRSPIILYDNPNASNPTMNQLANFLRNDKTDLEAYTPTHVCGDFAEEVHNRAEQQGIEAAFVILAGVNHAINAFQTTDAGLIFVDCTGGYKIPYIRTSPSNPFGSPTSWDKIAYVQKGKPLGMISLDAAVNYYGFSYSGYERWKTDKMLFDAKVNSYKNQVRGRYSVPQNEYYQLQMQFQEISQLAGRIGPLWGEMGTVQSGQIFWEGHD